MATYSCTDGYELVGEENRTCQVDGIWTGTELQGVLTCGIYYICCLHVLYYGPVQRPPPTPHDVHWNTSYQTTSAATPPSEAASSSEKDTGQVVEYEEIGPPLPKNNNDILYDVWILHIQVFLSLVYVLHVYNVLPVTSCTLSVEHSDLAEIVISYRISASLEADGVSYNYIPRSN